MNGNCETISRFGTWGEAGCRAGQGEVSENALQWVSRAWSLASGLQRGVKWGLEQWAGHSKVSENAPGWDLVTSH